MLVCHLRVLQLSIEFGGGTEAQDAAHSTSAAYSDGERTKKIGGSSKQNVRQLNAQFAFDRLSSKIICFLLFSKKNRCFASKNLELNRGN